MGARVVLCPSVQELVGGEGKELDKLRRQGYLLEDRSGFFERQRSEHFAAEIICDDRHLGVDRCSDQVAGNCGAVLEGATVASSWVPQLWCTIESHLAHCGTATHCNHSQARVRQVRIAASYGSEF